MLVLSRKPMQSIVIGTDITITIVRIERNQVRLAIGAPRSVGVLREELCQAAESEFETATGAFEHSVAHKENLAASV